MGVKSRDQQGGEDDRGEVQEHEIIVVHHVREDAPVIVRLAGVPPKQWQEAYEGARYPAHTYYTWKNRSSFPFSSTAIDRCIVDAPCRGAVRRRVVATATLT